MTPTDTSEKELERIITDSLITQSGYIQGNPEEYDRDYAVDLTKLLAFLQTTQPRIFEQLFLGDDGPKRLQFLARLQGEIAKRGVIDVLRRGVKHGAASVSLFYGTPTREIPGLKSSLLLMSSV